MARKGFLRPNERLFAPIVYLARETNISFMSNARRAALVQSIPLPSPLEAPDDWERRTEERQVRKGLFGSKKTAYKAALLLPKPLIFGSESGQMGIMDDATETNYTVRPQNWRHCPSTSSYLPTIVRRSTSLGQPP